MASNVALAIACDEACNQIEQWAAENVEGDLSPLPRVHKNHDILRKIQLEKIAEWTSQAQPDNTLDAVRELVQSDRWTKADIIAALLGDTS